MTAIGLASVVMALSLSVAMPIIWSELMNRFYYDNRPVITGLDCASLTESVVAGQDLVIRCSYSKRPGCDGRVSHSLNGSPDAAKTAAPTHYPLRENDAGWPPGYGLAAVARIKLPNYIPPGDYVYTSITRYDCQAEGSFGQSNPFRSLIVRSPSLPVRVIGGTP